MIHGSIKCNPHGLPNARVPPFHHFQLVDGLINTQRNHLGLGKPLPFKEKTEHKNHQPVLIMGDQSPGPMHKKERDSTQPNLPTFWASGRMAWVQCIHQLWTQVDHKNHDTTLFPKHIQVAMEISWKHTAVYTGQAQEYIYVIHKVSLGTHTYAHKG